MRPAADDTLLLLVFHAGPRHCSHQAQPPPPSSAAATLSPQVPSLLHLVRLTGQPAATAEELSQLLLASGVPVDHGLAQQLLQEHNDLRQQQDEERLRELLQACLECGPMASKGECWMVLSQLALGGEAAVQGS